MICAWQEGGTQTQHDVQRLDSLELEFKKNTQMTLGVICKKMNMCLCVENLKKTNDP